MLISDALWDKVRSNFTEEEKELLRKAVAGQTICPRGTVIDEKTISKNLLSKLKDLKDGHLVQR